MVLGAGRKLPLHPDNGRGVRENRARPAAVSRDHALGPRRRAGRRQREWLLSRGEDVFPIPGTKQQKWLEQNVAAVDLQLDPKEIETLSSTFRPGARAGDRYEPGYFVTLGA